MLSASMGVAPNGSPKKPKKKTKTFGKLSAVEYGKEEFIGQFYEEMSEKGEE